MFELYLRDGHRKEKLFDGEDLEEIARLSAEQSGEIEPEELLDIPIWEEDDYGQR